MREIITMGDVLGAFGLHAHTRYLGDPTMGDPAVVGSPAQVVGAPSGLRLHNAPKLNAPINTELNLLANGEEIGVVDTAPGDNGHQWFQVVADLADGSQTQGWVDGTFLEDVGAPPPAPAPAPAPPLNVLPPDPPQGGGQIVPVGPSSGPVAPSPAAAGGLVARVTSFVKAHPIPVAVGAVVVVGGAAMALKKK